MGIVRSIAAGAAGAAAVLFTAMAMGWAQDAQPQDPGAAPPNPMQGGFPDLISGISETPGCLGIETAQTRSGKNVIFAWFENKKAVQRWYYSEIHQGVMDMFFPDHDETAEAANHRPMQGVPDDIAILAIASVTMSDGAQFEQTNLPISQIAIELYAPLTGGLFLGGRFAPESLEVADMHDYTPAGSPSSDP